MRWQQCFLAATMAGQLVGSVEQRAMTVDDVVRSRQIVETAVSVDGRSGAAVVTEPSVVDNVVVSRLVVFDLARPAEVRTLAEVRGTVERMTNLRWSPDGRAVAFLAPLDGADEVWAVDVGGGRPRKVFGSPAPGVVFGGGHMPFISPNVPPHAAKVLAFEWAPDGRAIAFTAPRPMGDTSGDGVVYSDPRAVIAGEYEEVRNALWLWDADTVRVRHVVDSVQGPMAEQGKPKMAFSPDGKRLAFVARGTQQPTDQVDRVNVLDLGSGQVSVMDTGAARPLPPSWTADGRLVGVEGNAVVALPGHARLGALPEGGTATRAWGADVVSVRDERREAPYRIADGGAVFTLPDNLSECSFDAARRRGLCVRQSAATPPRLSIIDNQAIRDGYDPNRWVERVRVIAPRPVEWVNPAGLRATGYQLVPPGCGRCPAVVITHGYDARELFMADRQEWAFPSQVYAAKGYVVLLVNEPANANTADTVEARATMETAVRAAVDSGLVDPAKVAILGYSRGARVADESMIHSTAFAVAVGADDATQELVPGSGAPLATRFTGPLLQQMGPAALMVTPVHDYLRRTLRVPTELVIYPNETHIPHQPRHRAAAMSLNLDWIDYWLLGRRDPARTAQYERWDGLR